MINEGNAELYTANNHGWILSTSRLPPLPRQNLSIVEAEVGDKVLMEVPNNGGRIILHLTKRLGYNDVGLREIAGIIVDADSINFTLGEEHGVAWPSSVAVFGSVMRQGETAINYSKEQWWLYVSQEVWKYLDWTSNKKAPFKEVLQYLIDNNKIPTQIEMMVETKKPPKPKNGEKYGEEEWMAIRQKFLQAVCRRYRSHLESKASYIRLTGALYATLAHAEASSIYTQSDLNTSVRMGEQRKRVIVYFPYLIISIIYFLKAFSIFHVVEEGSIPDADNAQTLRPEDKALLKQAFGRKRR